MELSFFRFDTVLLGSILWQRAGSLRKTFRNHRDRADNLFALDGFANRRLGEHVGEQSENTFGFGGVLRDL